MKISYLQLPGANFHTYRICLPYRPFHGNCGAVIGACAQTLPDGNIFKHKIVICIALFTSAQIGKTVLLKRTVSVFFYLPQGCEEEKVLGKCCQQDRLVTTFSNFIMFGAFVDGWHSVSDDPVFSYNEKYRTDWICR